MAKKKAAQTAQTAKKAGPIDGPIDVIATRDGIYGDYRNRGRGSTYRKKGDAFTIADEKAFSKIWMVRRKKSAAAPAVSVEEVESLEGSEGNSEAETLSEMALRTPQGSK